MYQILNHWMVKPAHVSAISELHAVANRPGLYTMEVHLLGGQTLSIPGQQRDLTVARVALIQAVDAAE